MTFAARSLGYLASGPTTVLSTTLTIGTSTFGAGLSLRGFSSAAIAGATPTTFGSVASATLTGTGGKTVVSVYDDRDNNSPIYAAVVSISGFSSDPGQNFLYDVTANGVTKTVGTATSGGIYTYGYVSGTAIWQWENTTVADLFGFATSGTVSLDIRVP